MKKKYCTPLKAIAAERGSMIFEYVLVSFFTLALAMALLTITSTLIKGKIEPIAEGLGVELQWPSFEDLVGG